MSLIAISIGMTLLGALLGIMSISMVWVITNQLRLFLFLILSGAYLPGTLVEFIKLGTYFTFNFSFWPTFEFQGAKQVLENVDFPQMNANIKTIGLEFGSVIVNNFDLAFTIALIVIQHLLFRLFDKFVLKK
mmetsp:Transcript_8293/g.9401  ORF Transcript_8293/g.9401 Transcript_8293/m.9401 type:complete len:132 (+) Transcript_8293:634-1029(+)